MIEVLINSLPVFIVILFGVYFRKTLGKNAVKVVSDIVFNIAIPAVIITVLYGQTFTRENINLLIAPIIVSLLFALTGLLLVRIFKLSRKQAGVFIPSLMSFSIGVFAYPFILQNFNKEVFSQVVLVDIILFFLVLTVSYIIATTYSEQTRGNWKGILKKIFTNPSLITMVMVFMINYLGISLPELILDTAEYLSRPFAFLTSFLMGLTLTLPSKKQILVLASSFGIRTIVVIGALLLLMSSYLSNLETQVFALSFLTPFATLPVIYANELDLDEELASQMSVFSKLVSIVIYPLIIAWVI
jgi:predicted permease